MQKHSFVVLTDYISSYERMFEVFMRNDLQEEFKKEIQEKTTSTYLVVNNLDENVTYFFSVRAETLAGYGDEVIGNVTIGPNPGEYSPYSGDCSLS